MVAIAPTDGWTGDMPSHADASPAEFVARQLLRSIGVLRRTARDVASRQLPDAVERIRAGETVDVTVAPVGVHTSDEIGQLARAFDAVHGAGYRGVYDFSDLDNSRFAMPLGQSGNMLSPWARNFVDRWQTLGYVEITGNDSILDQQVPFLEGPILDAHEQEHMSAPGVSSTGAPLWEHCIRAIEHAWHQFRHDSFDVLHLGQSHIRTFAERHSPCCRWSRARWYARRIPCSRAR